MRMADLTVENINKAIIAFNKTAKAAILAAEELCSTSSQERTQEQFAHWLDTQRAADAAFEHLRQLAFYSTNAAGHEIEVAKDAGTVSDAQVAEARAAVRKWFKDFTANVKPLRDQLDDAARRAYETMGLHEA